MALIKRVKSKMYGVRVTHSNPEEDGSVFLGMDLMRQMGLAPGQAITINNQTTGGTWETWVEPHEQIGRVDMRGAAGLHNSVGDEVVLIAWMFV